MYKRQDEAKAFIEEFFGTFKVLKQWLERQGLLAVELGYSCSPRGRKRFYTLPADDAEDAKELIAQIKRWAGNMPIQAGNADILKVAMRNIYLEIRGGSFVGKKLYDARFLLAVHDEIVMVCAEKDIPAVKAIMARCMNDAYHQVLSLIHILPGAEQPGGHQALDRPVSGTGLRRHRSQGCLSLIHI